jgi:transcriptional regulator with PAS, ATPase and Fis domain
VEIPVSTGVCTLITVNCGAIPESLIDSELFGHEKGAFTGALSQKRGRFERAEGGTIFLDEIGELPMEAQVRFLRVLQDKIIERVGSTESLKLDIRIIAATNKNLQEMILKKEFREDLWYRLNVFPVHIPPLRERKKDIPALVDYLVAKKADELKLNLIPEVVPDSVRKLQEFDWPGNVRELQNLIERELIINPKGPLFFNDLQVKNSYTEDNTEIND